jgi:O-glycosyl hydrolase
VSGFMIQLANVIEYKIYVIMQQRHQTNGGYGGVPTAAWAPGTRRLLRSWSSSTVADRMPFSRARLCFWNSQT